MPRGPDPTPAELEFVYRLIAQGATDRDIINEYARLDEEDRLVYGFRLDVRFVRKRRKELAAAETVLTERLQRRLDPVLTQRRAAHFEDLSRVADLLLGGLEEIIPVRSATTEATGGQAFVHREQGGPAFEASAIASRLEENWEELNLEVSAIRLVSFSVHAMHSLREIAPSSFEQSMREHPWEVLRLLHILRERRTFESTCTVCEAWS